MSKLFVYGMPILWAVVAVPIALLLYKTSVAVLTRADDVQTVAGQNKIRKRKQIILGGSVAIAVVAFFGMYKGTQALKADDSKMDVLKASTSSVRNHFLSLKACFNSSPLTCNTYITTEDAAITSLEEAIAKLDE